MTLRDLPFRLSYGPSDDRLHEFYIPALSASVRYDRMTGFFTSTALAVAAEGVAHLIAGGGRMRLLVGAQLEPQDVEAIRAGHDLREVIAARLTLPHPDALADHLLRDRLAALAWMVATGALEIRVVLPKGSDGFPLPASEARDYFHPKVGIFTDAQGHQVAFSGSVNESETAWQHNYEQFMVFRSWTEEGRLYVAEAVGRFERLWEQREPDWIALPIPEAARRQLLRYAPSSAPNRDPLERALAAVRERAERLVLAPALRQEQVLCQFLRDAPYLAGAAGLGMATCALTPWPHQQVVARQLIERFPARYLLADEVGLGKTIEAGLMLRQLWLDGRVRRALILAPKSVLRQWQEELYEKFALDVPIYDGTVFCSIHGEERAPATLNPWDDVSLVLVSSQLVKRQERKKMLLAARPWDLVLVDEAHHARRRDFLDLERYRPNRMLDLLDALKRRTRGLILMTATPMQVHPIEVWDLLNLLGLSGEWGANDGRFFLNFYEELRKPPDETDWAFVFQLLRAELALRNGQLDEEFAATAKRELGPVDWARVCELVEVADPGQTIRRLPPPARSVAVSMIKRHTPLRRLVFRNTRELLREYRRRGLLRENVPSRKPRLEWIPMRPEERALYERIEEYIAHFYRKYESERTGLGFVMTVYRRRLTSSFYAVQQSLKRRLAFLKGQAGLELVEDDLEQDELSLDVDELGLADRSLFHDEVDYVEHFLHKLEMLGGQESKVAQLQKDLAEVFRHRETVLIFTQYTDTMDYLREALRPNYGSQVACYSGRGGERWDGVTWVPVTKEEIKNAFREGREIKVLLCTEAASEGLNLQTCGVLINYDMPWNPMRVEQRIGRIDRIGQKYDEVWIRNYFYEDTVEARVYQALSRRIAWFQDVVGPLQPILAQVGRVIQSLAMVPEAERRQALNQELARIQAQLDNAQAGLNLDEWARHEDGFAPPDAPVTLPELAAALTTAPTLQARFRPHEAIENAFWLRSDHGEVAVTFDPATFDAHPNTLHLLTYGNPLLDSLLAQVAPPDVAESSEGRLLRLRVETPWPRVAYYAPDADGRPRRLERLADVRAAMEGPAPASWPEEAIEAAQRDLEALVEAEQQFATRAQTQWEQAQRSSLEAQAARLLVEAALVELALGQQAELFGDRSYPAAFDQMAVIGLKRHGYPWAPLIKVVQAHIQAPRPTDPFFTEIQGESADQLRRRFEGLRQRAERLVEQLVEQLSLKKS